MNLRNSRNHLVRRDWIAQAGAVRIEDEIAGRGIKLNGRGPSASDHARSAVAPTDSRSTPASRFGIAAAASGAAMSYPSSNIWTGALLMLPWPY
jgi:hypothetical protein